MLKTKSFLCLDFGAGTLKLAEFDQSESGALRLRQFGAKPLGLAGAQDAARSRVLLKAIQDLLAEKPYEARHINACAPGFHVFSKFVKLPPVDSGKVTQIVQYEAQQNVPFPLEEVVWDYQILGSTPSGELEVLLVAIKEDLVEGLFKSSESAGLHIKMVDVSPSALCNAFRYNYGDLEDCTMLLDIGAKTSNVLFFEKGKVFARSINIGANSITQDFASEAKMPFIEAERFKISDGFVSLGGAYEEPENPRQAAISKVARQVMTRLHIQVNQTIQFYRGQQGGSAPQRLFLAGGASIMPYTAQFFSEKLNLEVEYFNPFRTVEIDPSVDLETLSKIAHSFGEVVGLGLRNTSECPVELNLIPKSLLKRQQFNQKRPYFIATVISIIAVVFALGLFYGKLASETDKAVADRNTVVMPVKRVDTQMNRLRGSIQQNRKAMTEFQNWIKDRRLWADMFVAFKTAMLETEKEVTQKHNGLATGVWIEKLEPELPDLEAAYEGGSRYGRGGMFGPMSPYMMDPRMFQRYFGHMMDPRYSNPNVPPSQSRREEMGIDDEELMSGGMDGTEDELDGTEEEVVEEQYDPETGELIEDPEPAAPTSPMMPGMFMPGFGGPKPTNEVVKIRLTCKTVNLDDFDINVKDDVAYTLAAKLAMCDLFKTNVTVTNVITDEFLDDKNTHKFEVAVELERPIKFQ
jgi:type IV pilus assembly protein PilM